MHVVDVLSLAVRQYAFIVLFVHVQGVAAEHNVTTLPAFHLWKDGVAVEVSARGSHAGAASAFTNSVASWRQLCMRNGPCRC